MNENFELLNNTFYYDAELNRVFFASLVPPEFSWLRTYQVILEPMTWPLKGIYLWPVPGNSKVTGRVIENPLILWIFILTKEPCRVEVMKDLVQILVDTANGRGKFNSAEAIMQLINKELLEKLKQ